MSLSLVLCDSTQVSEKGYLTFLTQPSQSSYWLGGLPKGLANTLSQMVELGLLIGCGITRLAVAQGGKEMSEWVFTCL